MDEIIENEQRFGDRITGRCAPFTDYVPNPGIADCSSEFALVEGTGLSCVTPPGITYELQDPANDPPRVVYQKSRMRCVEKNTENRGQKRGTGPSSVPHKKLRTGDYVSKAQLEAVCYAFQSHNKFFVGEYEHFPLETEKKPKGSLAPVSKTMKYRQGFLLADGTGAGKGRTLGRMVLEYYRSGGRKCLWVVAKKEPCVANSTAECRTFMQDVKPAGIKFQELNRKLRPIKDDQMILLRATYKQLTDDCNILLVEKWLGEDYDGMMIFDDFEMAKSAFCVQDSTCGKRAMRLQYDFPNARVVYSTGAAASAVEHLLCYPRLNLWGPNTIHSNSSKAFKKMIATRGVAYLEMIAMEMKMAGVYVSRNLPLSNVVVDMEQVIPSDDFACVYGRATELWAILLAYLKHLKGSFQEKFGNLPQKLHEFNIMQRPIYESCKNFFTMLIVSSKIAAMETSARRALQEDKSIVISMYHTGDFHTGNFSREGKAGSPFSTALYILRNTMLTMGIPLGCERTYLKNNEKVKIGECKDNCCTKCGQLAENCVITPDVAVGALQRFKGDEYRLLLDDFGQGMEMGKVWPDYTVGSYSVAHHKLLKDPRNVSWSVHLVRRNPSLAEFARLYHELSVLIPINPLDEIINRFECPLDLKSESHAVADLTGRVNRYTYNKLENKWNLVARKRENNNSQYLETNAFATGKKHVAVISTASAVGTNLYVNTKGKRHGRQLVHYTIEFPHNAETCTQQFGRAVSVQQNYPPIYRIFGSSIHGEKRHLSKLGWRLKSSGAIFRGHSAGNLCSSLIKEDYLYSVNGCAAINAAMDEVKNEHPRIYQVLEMLDCKRVDRIPETRRGPLELEITKKAHDAISSFLNQFFLIPPKIQDDLWLIIENKLVNLEKKHPTYRSIKCLPVNLEDVEIVGTRIIGTDGKLSTVYRFRIMRHATWEYVLQVKAANPSLCFFKCQENMLFAVYQTGERKICIRPFDRNEATLPDNLALQQVDQSLAETEWQNQVDRILSSNANCEHEMTLGMKCNKLKDLYSQTCTYHWGVTEVLLITGHMSEIARKLEDIWSIPAQMCKITWIVDGLPKHAAGLLVSGENCRYSIAQVFRWLETC